MKFLAYMFAFYSLALSFAPCFDMYEGQGNISQTVQQSANHHEQNNDICSPFCQCSCCHGFVVLGFIKNTPSLPAFVAKQFSLYSEKFPSSLASYHWQPPRIA